MCYHKFFKNLDMSLNPLPYERQRPPSFMASYNVELFKLESAITQEDKDHFQSEEWYSELVNSNNGKPLLDVNKFLKMYPHYKMEQVQKEKF